MELLIVIGIIGGIAFIGWLSNKVSDLRERAKKYVELKARVGSLDTYKAQLESKQAELKAREEAVANLVKEKTEGFPWLAQAYADYLQLEDLRRARYLEYKSHPARKAAEQVREVASQRRVAEKLYRVLKYKLEYYENLFPWLIDFTGEDIDDLIRQVMEGKEKGKEEPEDKVTVYTTPGERKTLSRQELFQRALDRWWTKPKSKWEIGRDYERYIGYLYESMGYSVFYQGIIEGLNDLGRDLICIKGNHTVIVQCKHWSQDKQIHEKHIFQLYGTIVAYQIDHPDKIISAHFVTSTNLSERAKQFANVLDIEIDENHPPEPYPCIKCNVSRRDGTKIYHLPFDQQYDSTIIEEEKNERYVETVKEAENLGFRRAFRWHGSIDSTALI
jgi:uncharacterized membrane-anchored protein YhcB (DUF1043 family)